MAIELQAILALGRKDVTVIISEPDDASDDAREFSTWMHGQYGVERTAISSVEGNALVGAFPNVVREPDLHFGDIDASPIFGPLLARTEALRRKIR